MKYEDARRTLWELDEKTKQAFFEYHRRNPGIWRAFEKFALEARASGRKRYGAKSVMERARWEVEIEKRGRFKIDNSFVAYYVRLFIAKHPRCKGMFELRKITGLKRNERPDWSQVRAA